ncbi:MAG TPA: TlpA disulfide reductase family protein [Bryobacteraceae bacterium]|nr:TlpA disulfide reductase family protein [Bryobacteraceae bacterium]
MDRKNERLLQGAIGVLAVALVLVVAGTLEAKVVNTGDTAPKFSIKTDSGKTISRSDFTGKLLVLNFWATWCAGCVEEMASLNAFARQFAQQGVVVLGISIDRNEPTYRRFLERNRVSFETARDPEAEISGNYGTFLLPETYLIDRSGKVLEKVVGSQNWMDPIFLARFKQML